MGTAMLTLKDCLVLVATLALTVSCQDQRLEIVPLFDGLTSTPGNQFTFQPQPAVPGVELELTSPRPPLNLQAFKAVPLAEPPTATIPPAVPHPSLKIRLHLPTPPSTTSPSPSPPPPPPTTTAAPRVDNLSVFGSSLPAVRPQ